MQGMFWEWRGAGGSTTVRDEESAWKECWWEMRASSKRLLVLGVLAGHA